MTSTQKYTGVADQDMRAAVNGLQWGQAPAAPPPPDSAAALIASLDAEQLRVLMGPLLAALAERGGQRS